MARGSGIGSWPGDDVRTTIRLVRDLLAEPPSAGDEPGIPYLPELPARGPGADIIGRTAGLLVDLSVDLQPSGWRLVDRPGRDAERTAAIWRRDLDDLAEAFDGYAGDLKVQVAGPWTLASELRVSRGERAIIDPGACRDVVASLAEGVRRHVTAVEKLLPGTRVVLQLDEPALPAVLAGRLPTSSGFGKLPAVDLQVAQAGIAEVLAAAGDRENLVHCCARLAPLPLLREAGTKGIALDTALLGPKAWESVAATIESGVRLWAGVVPTTSGESLDAVLRRGHHGIVEPLQRRWYELGLPLSQLDAVVLTPACGMAGLDPSQAGAVQRLVVDAAGALTEAVR